MKSLESNRLHVIQILDIVPHQGTVMPSSSHCIRFTFRSSEPIQVKAIALCEIFRGPTEIINVLANADTIQYSVDKQIIDFDQQVRSLLRISIKKRYLSKNFLITGVRSMIFSSFFLLLLRRVQHS